MPYRKRHQKRVKRGAKKAPYRRRKAKYQKSVITRMKGTGFPDSVYVRLNYVEYIQVTALTATYGQFVFRGNSCFDPNYTSSGHQPLYFDEYSAIYAKYRVIGSSCRVDSVNTSATSAAYFIMFPNTDSATFTSISAVLEQGRAKSPKILPINSRGPEGRLSAYCSTRKACGLTKPQLYDEDYAALVGYNPNQAWFWNLYWQSTDNTSPVSVNAVAKLVYYVQFFDKKIATQS